MYIPQKLADIFMEDIALTYLEKSPFSRDSEDFFSLVRYYMNNNFNISWSGGGTYGTCYDEDGPQEMSPDDEPEMTALDTFIEKYFADIDSDITYEIKLNAETDTNYESDYYGGQLSTHSRGISFYKIAETLLPTLYKNETEYVDFEAMLDDISLVIINMGSGDYDKLTFKNQLNDQIEEKTVKSRKIKI